jgi:hypothetical protein
MMPVMRVGDASQSLIGSDLPRLDCAGIGLQQCRGVTAVMLAMAIAAAGPTHHKVRDASNDGDANGQYQH